MTTSETITSIGYLIGASASLIAAVGVILRRHDITRWMASQATLVRLSMKLEDDLLHEQATGIRIKREAEAAQMAADYWESTAKAGRSMREEFDSMVRRFDLAEQRGEKIIRVLREVLRHQGVLESWFKTNGHPLPDPSPNIPMDLQKELETC